MAVKGTCSVTIFTNKEVQAVWRYYLLRGSTMSAPSIDDKTVRPPATGGTEWTAYEPAFSEGATNSLYFTDCMVFTDGSISYSEVSKSTSYEAAKAAYNKALGADGKINEMQENIYTDGTNTIDGSKITAGSIEKDQILEGSLSIDRMDDTIAGSYSDPATKHGSMEWKDDALHIKSTDSNEQNTYETVIGGDGIKFKWNGEETASIDQDELRINKTVVINAMEVGNWSWAIHPTTGNLMVKWNGGE